MIYRLMSIHVSSTAKVSGRFASNAAMADTIQTAAIKRLKRRGIAKKKPPFFDGGFM